MSEPGSPLFNRRKLLSLAGQGLVVSAVGSVIGCGGSGSGDGSSGGGTGGGTTTELTWNGNGLITVRNSSTQQSVSFATSVDLKTLRGSLTLAVLDSIGFKETRKVTRNGTTTTDESDVPVSLLNKPEWGIPGATTVLLRFDATSFDFQTGGGTYDTTGYNRFGRTGRINMPWSQVSIDTPPEPDRGKR